MTGPNSPSDPRKWLGKQAASTDAPRSRGKLFGVAAGVFLLVGALIALLLWIRPVSEPHFVGAWIYQHSDGRVPFRAWVDQDRDALLSLPWKDHDSFNQQLRRLFKSTLDDLAKFRDRPIVLYLSAYALRDEKGEVHILPGDGYLDEPSTWLPLHEVLQAMRKAESPNKLLILDIMQPLVVPELGLLDPYGAGNIFNLLEEASKNDPALLILGACSPCQIAMELEEEKRSVFAYYLEKGLDGAADGWNDKRKRDGRVSALELAAFVAARVDRWSRHNLGRPQTPFLLGSSDFTLVKAGKAAATEVPDPEEPEPYPDWLKKGWARLDAWWAQPAKRVPALSCAELQTDLLRVERDWHRGQETARLENELRASVDKLDASATRSQLESARAVPRSLEEAAALGHVTGDPLKDGGLTKLGPLARLHKSANAPKADQNLVKQWEVERDKFLDGYKDKPLDLAWLVWRVASSSEAKPGRDGSRFWGSLLNDAWRDVPLVRQLSFPETTFLRRLAEWAATYPGEAWPLEAVSDAVAVVLAGEQAAAESGPAWAGLLRDPADKSRAEGERLLFANSLDEAGPKLRAGLGEYNRLNQFLRILRQAQQTSDEATVQLLGYATVAEQTPAVLADWLAAVRIALVVRRLISEADQLKAPEVAKALSELESQAGELSERLNKLAGPFQRDRIKKLLTLSPRAGSAQLADMETALSGPRLTVAQRAELGKARGDLAGRLHRETLADDVKDDNKQTVKFAGIALAGENDWRERRDEVLRRARVSVGKLSLLRGKEYSALEAAHARAAASPGDASLWLDFVHLLRQAWK